MDDEYWFHFFSGRSKSLSWSDLLKKRLVVIVGEAGIGKTFEFDKEVKILTDENKAAFFLPLNLLNNHEGFNGAIIDQKDRYKKWVQSSEPGYFFLDSVDEARLNSPDALNKALITTRDVLTPFLKRVSFYISSRVTDWSIPEVKELVQQHLLKPTVAAETIEPFRKNKTSDTVDVKEQAINSAIDLEVFKLDPLSAKDAKKLAEIFGVTPIDAFWQQVEEGDYEFLATRPLDLQWMVARWKQTKDLGSYLELLEASITNRLTETNPSYVASGAVLSQTQLREGAEQLAATCIFSNRPYVQISGCESVDKSIVATNALPNLNAQEHLRLLGTAVFDEATYGRVKFHHRYVREYLAACWIDRQITAGLPVNLVLSLFIKSPFGEEVLLKSRRSVLCWLTTLNVKVRQKIIRHFPELLMLEGDPQRWSTEDVVEAFERFIKKVETGYKRDWWSDRSEVRRVARMLPPELLIEHINRGAKKPQIFIELLILVKNGGIEACADKVFSIYKDTSFSEREHHYALTTLAGIASIDHKVAIKNDLISGKLKSNELFSAALEVVGLENLSVTQLERIFSNTAPEDKYGSGPMAISIKSNLLPKLSFEETLKLLSGLLATLKILDVKKLAKRNERDDNRENWMLNILPDVLLHIFQVMKGPGSDAPEILYDASLIVENLRHTSYANEEDFRQLRVEIESHEGFRRILALRIALSEGNPLATISLTWAFGLIQFSKGDLDWLIKESLRDDIDQPTRQVWYEVARDIAFSQLHANYRKQVFIELKSGVDSALRSRDIEELKKRNKRSLQYQSSYKHKENERKEKERLKLEGIKSELIKDLDNIRKGDFNVIRWLVIHSVERASIHSYTKARISIISEDFGLDIGDAFNEGLARVWRQIDIPNPNKYLSNEVPWSGLIGLASVNHSFNCGIELTNLTSDEVARMVQLSVWEYDDHEPWLDEISKIYTDQVVKALLPWMEFEMSFPDNSYHLRTIDLALKCPIIIKTYLLKNILYSLQKRKVSDQSLQKRLCSELIDIGLASKELIKEIASEHLLVAAKADPPVFESEWFKLWAKIDLPAAWKWFEDNNKRFSKKSFELANIIGESLERLPWEKSVSGTVEEIKVLRLLFKFLNDSMTAGTSSEDHSQSYSVSRVREIIIGILVNLQNPCANETLNELISEYRGTLTGNWLFNKSIDHASAMAELESAILPADLIHLGEVYTRNPQTEGELFEQVMARLIEIRNGIENGPFSDRNLFYPQIDEEYLQLWLAARLDDTPLRRFISRYKVFRESVLDLGNKPDIEVSCSAGKVCIEVKPLDSSRAYSANSLTDTLKDQLVDKYLRGENCKYGVLVLFRLDTKKWQIPNGPSNGDFEDLINFLSIQASRIKSENSNVERLEIFGINCL